MLAVGKQQLQVRRLRTNESKSEMQSFPKNKRDHPQRPDVQQNGGDAEQIWPKALRVHSSVLRAS